MIDIFIILLLLLCMRIVTTHAFKTLPSSFKSHGNIMLLIHVLTIFGFYFLTRNGGGDAWGYWRIGQSLTFEEAIFYLFSEQGTYFLYGFNYFLSGALGMGFLANTFVYGALGYVGLLCFYKVAVPYVPYPIRVFNIPIFPFLFYIPMVHFWSSGVGKDTLLLFCIGITVYASVKILKRIPILLMGLLLSYFIRPHITLMLVMAYGLAFLISKNQSLSKRVLLGAVLLFVGIGILPSVLEFAKIGEASLESFNEFSDNKASLLSRSHTGSSIDVSSYPLPLKWFTFLFRPLIFDINGIPALVASFENLFIIALTFKVWRSKPLLGLKQAPMEVKAMFFFLVLGTLAFAPTLGNLGIMIRMRNMFLPGMFLFYLYVLNASLARTQKRPLSPARVS